MAAAELKEISKSVQGMNAATGQFKQAAADNNRNVSKVIKDLSSVFTSQKKDISGLGNAIQESLHEAQQTSGKIDNTNSLLQESISIQNLMYGQLRNVSSGIDKLNNLLLSNMPGGQQAAGGAGGATPRGSGGGNVAAALLAGGVGGGAIAAATMGDGAATQLKQTATAEAAKKAADQYIGRELSPSEWSELVRATNAEAGKKDQTEAAMVMASILNRARSKNKTVEEILRERNQFQAVTGTKQQPGPSPNFTSAPTDKRSEEIYGAAANILKNVSKEQKNFTAASAAAYGPGTRPQYREELLGAGGRQVGGSIFNTAPPSQSQQTGGAAEKQEAAQATTSEKLKDQVDKTFKLGGGMTGNIGNVERLSPDLQTALSKALKEYQEKTGKTATITSGHRTTEEQEKVGATFGIKAKPGTSKHEKGNAVDVSSADAREMESMGILAKYGLHRPLGERDPVHIELKSGGGGESRGEGGEPRASSEGARMMGGQPAMGGRMDMGAMNPLAQLGMLAGGLFGGAGGAAIGGILGNLGGMAMSSLSGEQQTARLQPQTTVSPIIDKSTSVDQSQKPEDVTAAQYFREDKLRSAKMLQEQAAAKEVAMTTTVKKEEETKAVSPPAVEAGQQPTNVAMDYNRDSDRSELPDWSNRLAMAYSQFQNKMQFA